MPTFQNAIILSLLFIFAYPSLQGLYESELWHSEFDHFVIFYDILVSPVAFIVFLIVLTVPIISVIYFAHSNIARIKYYFWLPILFPSLRFLTLLYDYN